MTPRAASEGRRFGKSLGLWLIFQPTAPDDPANTGMRKLPVEFTEIIAQGVDQGSFQTTAKKHPGSVIRAGKLWANQFGSRIEVYGGGWSQALSVRRQFVLGT